MIGKHKHIYAKIWRPEGVGGGAQHAFGSQAQTSQRSSSFPSPWVKERRIGGARRPIRKRLPQQG